MNTLTRKTKTVAATVTLTSLAALSAAAFAGTASARSLPICPAKTHTTGLTATLVCPSGDAPASKFRLSKVQPKPPVLRKPVVRTLHVPADSRLVQRTLRPSPGRAPGPSCESTALTVARDEPASAAS